MAKGNTAEAVQAQPQPKPVSGPAQPATRGKGAVELPPGWGDTVVEKQWEGNDASLFGAMSFEKMNQGDPVAPGFVPGDAVELKPGEKAPDMDDAIKAALDEAKAAALAPPKKAKAAKVKADGADTLTEDDDTPEVEPIGDEVKADPEAEEPAKEPEPVKPESSSMLRRQALAALKLAAEKRELEQRLQAERDARAADQKTYQERSQDRQTALEALKRGSLAERLRAVGIDNLEAVQEAFLRGELKELPEVPVAAPGVDPQELAQIRNELAITKRDASIQAILVRERSGATVDQVIAEATRTWTAAGNKPDEGTAHINKALEAIINGERAHGSAMSAIDAELANVEAYPAPLTRATKGAMDTVRQVALTHWRQAGQKPGDYAKFVRFAVQSTEDYYTEQYEPLRAVFGVAPSAKPAAKPAPGKAKAPAPPIGTRVAAATPVEEDEGPMDGALRDRWIKDNMRKKGFTGW